MILSEVSSHFHTNSTNNKSVLFNINWYVSNNHFILYYVSELKLFNGLNVLSALYGHWHDHDINMRNYDLVCFNLKKKVLQKWRLL